MHGSGHILGGLIDEPGSVFGAQEDAGTRVTVHGGVIS